MSNAFRSASIERMKALASPEESERANLLGKLKSKYIANPKEGELREQLELILAHLTSDFHDEAFGVAVSGPSGAGKTTMVREALHSIKAFAPYRDEYNNPMNVYLRVRTPPACSMKTLGRRILRAAGYPLGDKEKSEGLIWTDVADTLRRKNCHILVFDEFQHALKAKQVKGPDHITDTVKAVMQEEDWPLYLIMVGVPEMLKLIELDPDDQVRRRVRTIHLEDVKDTDETINETASTLALLARSCSLRVAFPVRKKFIRRLMHGGLWRHGLIIQLIKMSIECALMERNGTLTSEHFIKGYKRLSDCDDDSNVFVSEDWEDIRREVTEEGTLTSTYTKRKKRDAAA